MVTLDYPVVYLLEINPCRPKDQKNGHKKKSQKYIDYFLNFLFFAILTFFVLSLRFATKIPCEFTSFFFIFSENIV